MVRPPGGPPLAMGPIERVVLAYPATQTEIRFVPQSYSSALKGMQLVLSLVFWYPLAGNPSGIPAELLQNSDSHPCAWLRISLIKGRSCLTRRARRWVSAERGGKALKPPASLVYHLEWQNTIGIIGS